MTLGSIGTVPKPTTTLQTKETTRSCIRERHNTLPVTALIGQSQNPKPLRSIDYNKGLSRFSATHLPLTSVEQLISTCLQKKPQEFNKIKEIGIKTTEGFWSKLVKSRRLHLGI